MHAGSATNAAATASTSAGQPLGQCKLSCCTNATIGNKHISVLDCRRMRKVVRSQWKDMEKQMHVGRDLRRLPRMFCCDYRLHKYGEIRGRVQTVVLYRRCERHQTHFYFGLLQDAKTGAIVPRRNGHKSARGRGSAMVAPTALVRRYWMMMLRYSCKVVPTCPSGSLSMPNSCTDNSE